MNGPSQEIGGRGEQPSPQAEPGRHSGGAAIAQAAQVGPPDLAAIAREAVIGFLRDQFASPPGPAEAEMVSFQAVDADQPAAAPSQVMPARATPAEVARVVQAEAVPGAPARAGELARALPGAGDFAAQTVARQAAAISVAALDRIESAAARLEADIAAARQEQADLQARAGLAAEEAVRAAQEAWASAGTAEEASQEARKSLHLIGGWVIAVGVLALIQLLIMLLFSSTSH